LAEQTGDHEWRIEGEEAGAVLYAPDDAALSYTRLLSGLGAATRLPGVEDPVHAAASPHGWGWAAASASHVAPELVSTPRFGLLLAASSPPDRLGVAPEEVPRLLERRLSEVRLPRLGGSDLRAACESGTGWAADTGIIGEEDLEILAGDDARGEPDTLGRRALAAGEREWDPRRDGPVEALEAGEAWDVEAAEGIGLHEGALVFILTAGGGELGRLALESHRERIASREFGDSGRLAAAPAGTEEAGDLVAAVGAASGYAAARLSLLAYAVRQAVGELAGSLDIVACSAAGGFQERGGTTVHRNALARLDAGRSLVCGDVLARGTGEMLGSAPLFEPAEAADEGRWTWEEAGLLERVARLRSPGNRG